MYDLIPCKGHREWSKLNAEEAVRCEKNKNKKSPPKQRSMLSEKEIPELLWCMVEKGIRSPEVDILEWMYCVKPEDPPDD